MTSDSVIDLLRQHHFFAGLSEPQLVSLATCGKVSHSAVGEHLTVEGQPADRMYALHAGRVALEVVAADRDPLVIDTISAGEVLGVSWLVEPHRWAFDSRVVEPVTAVMFDATCLQHACDVDPTLGHAVMRRLAIVMHQRMRSARVRLLDVYSHGSG